MDGMPTGDRRTMCAGLCAGSVQRFSPEGEAIYKPADGDPVYYKRTQRRDHSPAGTPGLAPITDGRKVHGSGSVAAHNGRTGPKTEKTRTSILAEDNESDEYILARDSNRRRRVR